MKFQIKRDEKSKDTKNQLRFKKAIRKMLMQRKENKIASDTIDEMLDEFAQFDPLLDWEFTPICGCEIEGMEGLYYNLKHNRLFGKNGYLLADVCTSSCGGPLCAREGYELWLLDDLSLVFTYYCQVEDAITHMGMCYRYPMGKKIPLGMHLNTEEFLEDLGYDIFTLRRGA